MSVVVKAQTNAFPSTGNVGIGTLVPGSKLTVAGTGNAAISITTDKGAGGIATPLVTTQYFRGWADHVTAKIASWDMSSSVAYGGGLHFYTSANMSYEDSAFERLTITHTGKIGVGNTNPLRTFDISGDAGISSNLFVNGKLGVGTSNPTDKLSVASSAGGSFSITTDQVAGGIGSPLRTTQYFRGWADHVIAKIATWDMSSSVVQGGGLHFYTSNDLSQEDGSNERLTILPSGEIGIGTNNPSQKLSVNGNVSAKKMIVTQSGWPDYVFHSSYSLKPLSEVASFIQQNKHLPDVPSAQEVEEKGISLGDNQALLLKKIEELTLYLIEMKEENTSIKKEMEVLKKRVDK